MSAENIELTHRACEASNSRDRTTFSELMHPEIEVQSVHGRFWQAIEWRDGRSIWWRNCSTEAEALEAIAERTGTNG